jgi:uncharacterized protein
MTKANSSLVSNTIKFVKLELKGAEGGHDWFHIERVWKNAKLIAVEEQCDLQIVEISALLHDIADAKFHAGDETIGPQLAREFLATQEVGEEFIEAIVKIIENISFKSNLEGLHYHSIELDVVRDADRLDAMGAIGIARAFNYGGFKNRELYNPEIPPINKITKEEYKKSTAPTINHFYEKLLLLKDLMKTGKGKELAEQRHAYMHEFLTQFYQEWG